MNWCLYNENFEGKDRLADCNSILTKIIINIWWVVIFSFFLSFFLYILLYPLSFPILYVILLFVVFPFFPCIFLHLLFPGLFVFFYLQQDVFPPTTRGVHPTAWLALMALQTWLLIALPCAVLENSKRSINIDLGYVNKSRIHLIFAHKSTNIYRNILFLLETNSSHLYYFICL